MSDSCDSRTVACWAPLSMEFSRQEYWSGLPFPSPRDLPDPGIKPRSPALQADSLPTEVEHRNLGCRAECNRVVEKGWDDYLIHSPQNFYHLPHYSLATYNLGFFFKENRTAVREFSETPNYLCLFIHCLPTCHLKCPHDSQGPPFSGPSPSHSPP